MSSEIFSIIKKITFKRVLNLASSEFSYFISYVLKRRVLPSFPVSLSVEPTNCCNLSCPHCPTGLKTLTRKQGNITLDSYYKVIDETSSKLVYLMLYFQGEPFLNKDIIKMIEYAEQKGLYVMTSTNAHFINEENVQNIVESGLDKLIISLDGITEEVYTTYRRGGKLEKVRDAIKSVVACKKKLMSKKPFIELQFIVFSHNEHQIDDAKKLSKELGVDKISFKSAQIYDINNNFCFLPSNEKYSRYKLSASGNHTLKRTIKRGCYKMWSSAVITWDGNLVPCCYDKDANFIMGNINEKKLKEILGSPSYLTFRNNILKKRALYKMCSNCIEK